MKLNINLDVEIEADGHRCNCYCMFLDSDNDHCCLFGRMLEVEYDEDNPYSFCIRCNECLKKPNMRQLKDVEYSIGENGTFNFKMPDGDKFSMKPKLMDEFDVPTSQSCQQ